MQRISATGSGRPRCPPTNRRYAHAADARPASATTIGDDGRPIAERRLEHEFPFTVRRNDLGASAIEQPDQAIRFGRDAEVQIGPHYYNRALLDAQVVLMLRMESIGEAIDGLVRRVPSR